MMKLIKVVFIIFFNASLSMSFVIAQDAGVLPKGARLFSIAITPPEILDLRSFWQTYENALDLAIATGIDLPGELSFVWSQVEQRNLFGKIRYQDDNSIRLIEILKQKSLPVVITITPFETTNNRIPKDLHDLPYDNEKVIKRLQRFIDWIYEATEGLDVVSVVLGNEYDVYLALQAAAGNSRWYEFEKMVAQTKTYVKSLERWRTVPFALETTYNGLTGSYWQELKRINQLTDIIGVSYYPLAETSVLDPAILHEHLIALFRIYPNKQVDFYQFGYPSSRRLNSSLEKQRQFVEETFKAWDKYGESIRLITFTWLYEAKKQHIDSMNADVLTKNIPVNEVFIEFLGSLGLHGTTVGSEKPVFKELKKQLQLRGWLD